MEGREAISRACTLTQVRRFRSSFIQKPGKRAREKKLFPKVIVLPEYPPQLDIFAATKQQRMTCKAWCVCKCSVTMVTAVFTTY